MKRVAIMQPYFMPYIGYFQLIDSCELFVISDSVQYRKGGWINRNRLLINGKPSMFTLSLKKAPLEYNINQRYFSEKFKIDKEKLIKTIDINYSKAPHFLEVRELIEEILSFDNYANVAEFNYNSIKKVCEYIGIKRKFIKESEISKDDKLKCEDAVIDITKKLHGQIYINSIGGKSLYSKERFKKSGIKLYFIKTNDIKYTQFKNEFQQNLSIIDVLMFNSKDEIMKLIKDYQLV